MNNQTARNNNITLNDLNRVLKFHDHIKIFFDSVAARHIFGSNKGPEVYKKFYSTAKCNPMAFIKSLSLTDRDALIAWYNNYKSN